MECTLKFQKFCLVETRRWIFMVGLVAITYLLCQSLLLPYGNALLSLLPDRDVPIYDNFSSPTRQSSVRSFMVNKSLLSNASDLTDTSLFVEVVEDVEKSNVTVEFGDDNGTEGTDEDIEDGLALEREDLENIVEFNEDDNGPKEKGGDTENFASESKGMDHVVEFTKDNNISKGLPFKKVVDMDGISALEYVNNQENSSDLKKDSEMRHIGSAVHIVKPPNEGISTDNIVKADASLTPSTPGSLEKEILSKDENLLVLQSDLADLNNNSAMTSNPGRKKMQSEMPPKSVTSIYDMNRRLVRHRASSRAMRPRWASPRDQEMLAAKLQIQNAPRVKNDPELHAPLFRNVSMFKRSYELMERILKVYVYKDGEKPIFHQPILKGLYASEGWFMKLMERNKHFVVKDPRQAQLFYMPFSSRMLEYKLYVRNSHNRTNLRQYLKQYSEKIAAKYRFWNRTGGADHFLVACHDWAPYETRHHMEQCIKALCNADVTAGFKIGRDVSLPETYVRSARNPLRDLGGKPPSERHILAFYAGNMHGYLRPILLKYWKDKDPDMKIYGPMPPGVASKMNYIQHMKSSKFCICPKGYEVNSPRVVEAIFYECVPVIISDNFVPPFFDVLDWGAFSIILAEKDIPNLKDVLLSIPNDKYLQMQLGVRKVQKHFLWHAKPLKYDLFHMTLHSIWYNRVFQVKPR
ncbi:probable glycosyltransferase At3g07620 isoform X2 [Vitis vinifera]|uniref:probable glycosyltransferase At3g07620 isoform X2 n=1 Tax=Vitis vinifera TaxID=29760 RepID=UPI00053FA6B7|nr:probable glycosyltransferase At3g07620 isoform X2 [Vitis vinifera]|eukprot:XP_010656275.1 PREDICTED: probable glycosyltransferase At3g07620 isoform X2 [Vitis vinifera]